MELKNYMKSIIMLKITDIFATLSLCLLKRAIISYKVELAECENEQQDLMPGIKKVEQLGS